MTAEDEAFLERAIINTLREQSGVTVDARFEAAAAKMVSALDAQVRDMRRAYWVADGATPEETLDAVCEAMGNTVIKYGMTAVLSASIPAGKMHYSRVVARSAKRGDHGAALVDGCFEQAAEFQRYLDSDTQGGGRD